jgi:hypothetical protein
MAGRERGIVKKLALLFAVLSLALAAPAVASDTGDGPGGSCIIIRGDGSQPPVYVCSYNK